MALEYRNNELYCEDVPLTELHEEFGTPLYVYSRTKLLENFQALDAALSGIDHVTCFALKANSNVQLLKVLAEHGAGADVVSGGELLLARKAGFPPERMVFAGVGKREDELEFGLKEDIFCFNVESVQELQLISRVALRLQKTARVALRINPDINAESHPYISTALKEHKFGIPAGESREAFRVAASLPNLEVCGVHVHLGSQIVRKEPYTAAATFLSTLVRELRGAGISIAHVDIGGGFGVRYKNVLRHEGLPEEQDDQESIPSPAQFIDTMLPVLRETGCRIWLEPGRAVIADAGLLLTQVLYRKENRSKRFLIVDAGMNDLLRPSLYNAYHQIVPVRIETYEHEKTDIVGPVCETGDFFARDRQMPKTKQRDLLAILTTGAYGFVNASNYNSRLRPAEVLVNGDRVRVIRPRQTMNELAQ
ncbi:MAG: diaminopimelate decarboxylase [Ignavibacteriales bacterium]|nr:diaminopimelate decarboxylase [Ignavibacteriales bacterium]